jgi:hypothetical protein
MSNDIELMVATSRQVFESAKAVIDGMGDGERIQIKDLAKKVGMVLVKEPKEVLGFVNHFAHNTVSAYVTRGKNGGIIKGTRPAKVVKVGKKQKKVADASVSSSDIVVMTPDMTI